MEVPYERHPAPQPGISFTPTRWSMVQRALQGGEPLNTWLGMYWFPLYAWSRRQGVSPEDASDRVQEFLSRLCGRKLLAQANPQRGRLRNWLLKSFSNHLKAHHRAATRLRRGGGAVHISIDASRAESAYLADPVAPSLTPDQAYTRAWALTLMDEALERLAHHYRKKHRFDLFEALAPALEAPLAEESYAEVADRLGMNAPAVRQAAVRMRARYRRLLLETAAQRLGISCETRLEAELRDMLGPA